MSGEVDILPNPSVDPSDYEFEIKLFQRSMNYKEADQKIKVQFDKYLEILDAIRKSQMMAFQDFNVTEGLQGQLANEQQMMAQQGGQMPPQGGLGVA